VNLEDRITIATPEGVELDVQLAGLASRFIAGVTDLIIQLILVVVLVLVTGAVTGGGPADLAAFLIGVFLIWFGYPIGFEMLARGRTPGKRFTQLRVVREDGSAVDLAASAIRNFMRLVDGLVFLFIPTIVMIPISRQNQRPGDWAAGTLVIREEPRPRARRATAAADPVSAADMIESWEGWDVTAVTDADIATVRRFLGRRDTLDRRARGELARRMAEGLSAKVAGAPRDGSPERFLETLVEAKGRRRDMPITTAGDHAAGRNATAADSPDILLPPGERPYI
jgi:uncharacterized RDD family membrane protein YckC